MDACDDSWLRNVSHIDLFWEKQFQIETRIRLWQEWLHTITVKNKQKNNIIPSVSRVRLTVIRPLIVMPIQHLLAITNTVSALEPNSIFFFCLLVFASTLSSAILYTEHVFAFKDILLVSQTSSLDENASESKQQAVIPANNGRYCGEIFLTKLTLHHCFKISLNTV